MGPNIQENFKKGNAMEEVNKSSKRVMSTSVTMSMDYDMAWEISLTAVVQARETVILVITPKGEEMVKAHTSSLMVVNTSDNSKMDGNQEQDVFIGTMG